MQLHGLQPDLVEFCNPRYATPMQLPCASHFNLSPKATILSFETILASRHLLNDLMEGACPHLEYFLEYILPLPGSWPDLMG